MYSLAQRITIVEAYVCTGSIKKTRDLFASKHPEVSLPAKSTIQELIKKWRKTGSVINAKKKRPNRVTPFKNPAKKLSLETNTIKKPQLLDAGRQPKTHINGVQWPPKYKKMNNPPYMQPGQPCHICASNMNIIGAPPCPHHHHTVIHPPEICPIPDGGALTVQPPCPPPDHHHHHHHHHHHPGFARDGNQ